MASVKQTLARYINAYASAQASGNQDLQAFAANQLSTFIEELDLPDETVATPPVEVVEEAG